MSKKKKKEIQPIVPADHKLVTRRDFVAHGLVGATSWFVMPTAANLLLSNSARAEGNCLPLSGHSLTPVITIDCAGGIGMSGKSQKRLGADGNPLANAEAYKRMAIPQPNSVDTSMGAGVINDHGGEGIAGLYLGLQRMSAAARSRTRIGTIATRSSNDTGSNPAHPGLIFARAIANSGGSGSLYRNGISDQNSSSGGRQRSPKNDPTLRPLAIGSDSDAAGALSMGMTGISSAERDAVRRYLGRVGDAQLRRLGNLNVRQQFDSIMSCILGSRIKSEPDARLDVSQNADATAIYQLANTGTVDGFSRRNRGKHAAIVYGTLMGYFATGNLQLGGCDYHNSAAPEAANHGDNRDRQLGVMISNIIELAHRLGKPVFIAVISDGSTSVNDSQMGSRIWTSDSTANSMASMFYYNPAGAVNGSSDPVANFAMARTQVGHYTFKLRSGKPLTVGAEASTYVGNSPARCAYTLLLNYLAVNSRSVSELESKFRQIVDDRDFDSAQIAASLIFNPVNRG